MFWDSPTSEAYEAIKQQQNMDCVWIMRQYVACNVVLSKPDLNINAKTEEAVPWMFHKCFHSIPIYFSYLECFVTAQETSVGLWYITMMPVQGRYADWFEKQIFTPWWHKTEKLKKKLNKSAPKTCLCNSQWNSNAIIFMVTNIFSHLLSK